MKNLIKRYLTLIFALFVMAFGIALTVRADLGTSPISSAPYVASLITPLTMGQTTVILHLFFIAIQIAILRREFQLFQLFQIAVAFVFGFFTDFTLWLTEGWEPENYVIKWLFVIGSCVIMGFGVFLQVRARAIVLAGEGAMLAIAQKLGVEFGKVKIAFDCSLVILAVIISFLGLSALVGVREGTVFSALFVGICVRFFAKHAKFVDAFLGNETQISIPAGKKSEISNHLVITIAREYGSNGLQIGERLAKKLNLKLIDKSTIIPAMQAKGANLQAAQDFDEKARPSLLYGLYEQNFAFVENEQPIEREIFALQNEVITELANSEPCVIVGRLGNFILQDRPNTLHLFICANLSDRIKTVCKRDNLGVQEAREKIKKIDYERKNHCKVCVGKNWGDRENYSAIFDVSQIPLETAIEVICKLAKNIKT